MAKSKSYFSLRRGSTKSQTFSVLRGQQITKDRVTEVANPKTTAQMRQRAIFATAVKFYKHANQNFFKFAFEDKKQRESEYNAFMRHNLQHSVIMSYETSKNEMYPAIGNGWQLTQGQLSSPAVSNEDEVVLTVAGILGSETTWGTVSAKIINYYGLQSGDIITFVGINSQASVLGSEPEFPPRWDIYQLRLDPSSSTPITDTRVELREDFISVDCNLSTGKATAVAVIFSRNIAGSGVKVSTSYLVNNDVADAILENLLDEAQIEANLNSWGATGKAILQGALVQE